MYAEKFRDLKKFLCLAIFIIFCERSKYQMHDFEEIMIEKLISVCIEIF